MMTLRRYVAAQYDWTGLTSNIYRSTAWEIGSLFVVAVAVLALVVLYHVHGLDMTFSELTDTEFAGAVGLEHMFGKIAVFTRLAFSMSLFFLLTNAARMYWLTMHRGVSERIPLQLYLTEARSFIVHALTQRRLRDCADRSRWYFHLLLASGCVLMFILLFFGLEWFQTDGLYPVHHPQRWLGYLATAAILVGVGDILIGRTRKLGQTHRFSGSTDWILPLMLLLTALSGIAVHILRYAGFASAMHYTYAAHVIVSVPLLLVEIPFGKGSHIIYRPLAMYFQAVKERSMQQQSSREAVLGHAG
jgi:hypothetical protein